MEEKTKQIQDELQEILNGMEQETDMKKLEEAEARVKELQAEKRNLEAAAEKRKMIRSGIAAGTLGTVVQTFEEDKQEQRKFAPDSAEYRTAYLRQLQGFEIKPEERAAIAASGVIATQTMNKIVEKLEQTSALYSKITVTNFPNNLTIPVENAKTDANWIMMGTAATDGADSFSNITLGAYKLIKTIEISADVKAMSIDAFESFIVTALTKKMQSAIENAILNGTGTNQPTGLLATGEVTQTGTFTKSAMKYSDLMKLLSDLPTMYHPGACITMPRKLFFAEIAGMETTQGSPVVVMDPQSPAKFSLLGYPVILNDYMPDDTIILGDMSYYHFNWAKAMEISQDTSVAFRTGSTVYRALALADGKKTNADAFVKYTRASA